MDPSGPFKGDPSGYIFILFSCPLHPMGSSSNYEGPMGWWIKALGMTVQKNCGSIVSMRLLWTAPTLDRLFRSHYDTWHVSLFDWILPRIEASLRLPCTSSININVFLSHFSIFCRNTLLECNHHLCQRPLRSVAVSIINTLPPFIHKIGKYSLFTSPFYPQIHFYTLFS